MLTPSVAIFTSIGSCASLATVGAAFTAMVNRNKTNVSNGDNKDFPIFAFMSSLSSNEFYSALLSTIAPIFCQDFVYSIVHERIPVLGTSHW